MKQIDICQVLSEMRALASQAGGPQRAGRPSEAGDFAALLKHSIDTVSDTQTRARELAESFERGDPKVQLSEVMIALQKARISFQAMTQVRNKLLEAYQDIKNMPI